MKKRYEKDALLLQEDLNEARDIRDTPCPVGALGHRLPLEVLEALIKLWPLHDLRYNSPDCYSTDEPLMVDLVKGMDLLISQRDLSTGTLETVVMCQNNLAEYERYNLVVEEHNRAWDRQGRPETVFDPVHGEVYKINDKYVDPAQIQSSYYPQPKSVYDNPSGPLSKARPTITRKGYVRVVYRLAVGKTQYTLGYNAYDSNDRVIYYNELTHPDLAYLVRRSVQELWGNPNETTKEGRYLDGIPMLIQGKKLPICTRDNKRPAWLLADAQIKAANPELMLETAKQCGYQTLSMICGYVVPLTLIIALLALLKACEWQLSGGMVLGVGAILAGFMGTRWLTQYATRKVSEIEVEKRFI